MIKRFKQFFNYIRHLWEGHDNKPSIRTVLAIWLTYDFIRNCHYGIKNCLDHIGEVALVLGIEAGLIAALLALKMYQTMKNPLNNTSEN